MKPIYFVTGNANKFAEAKLVIPSLEQIDIDLPEIQEVDPKVIITEKLKSGIHSVDGDIIVEDVGLYFNDMNGLPGPLIKWFLKTIGNEGLAKLAKNFGQQAQARSVIGFSNGGDFKFFEGSINGYIVEPRGNMGFGWDPVFEIAEVGKTFAELTMEEKTAFSMRRMAFERLANYLKR